MTHSSPTRRSSDLEHDAIAGRHGAVVGGLGAHDEIGGVVGGQEVAAGGIVPEVAVEKSNPTFRLRQGVGLAGSLVERQGGGGHFGVVVDGCRMLQQIGRASGRERGCPDVEISVFDEYLKK